MCRCTEKLHQRNVWPSSGSQACQLRCQPHCFTIFFLNQANTSTKTPVVPLVFEYRRSAGALRGWKTVPLFNPPPPCFFFLESRPGEPPHSESLEAVTPQSHIVSVVAILTWAPAWLLCSPLGRNIGLGSPPLQVHNREKESGLGGVRQSADYLGTPPGYMRPCPARGGAGCGRGCGWGGGSVVCRLHVGEA